MQLLPPILRSPFLVALLRVLAAPFRYVCEQFTAYRATVAQRLCGAAYVQYLEKVLNDAFHLTDGQIYIETPEDEPPVWWHMKAEGQTPPYLYTRRTGSGLVMKQGGESSYRDSFIVCLPSFLCTSTDPAADKYKGEHLQTVKNLLAYYKPAGRTYRIMLYDYE